MAQFLGKNQLDNLRNSNAKFLMALLLGSDESSADVPAHPMIKTELIVEVESAATQIQKHLSFGQYPVWWPIILMSKDGQRDASVAALLEKNGFINVYSYQGGWSALLDL